MGEQTKSLEEIAQFLFQLLDDIDTFDDIAGPHDQLYRGWVRNVQKRRFEVASTDGYKVWWRPGESPEPPDTPVDPSPEGGE